MRKFNGNFGFNASKIKADKDRSRDAYYEILKKVDSKKPKIFIKYFILMHHIVLNATA